MSGRDTAGPRPRFGWLPSLLVGASAAVAAEVAVAVLLYGGPGLLRSLTTVLAVEALAFAGGLATAPAAGSGFVDRLRRSWLFCLIGFLVAALFGTAWSLLPTLGSGRWGQGAGLAILGGLPAYCAGTVLGGIAVAARTDVGGRLRSPGPPAAVGAALGFVLTGLLIGRAPMPASLLIGCLVLLSLGGMSVGALLRSRRAVHIVERSADGGTARVEERHGPGDEIVRVLREGGRTRRAIVVEAAAPANRGEAMSGPGRSTPWDVAVVRGLMPAPDAGWRVLFVGSGASGAPRTVLREHPLAVGMVMERSPDVLALARTHFDTALPREGSDRMAVATGNLDDLVAEVADPGHFDLVVIDVDGVGAASSGSGLSDASWRRLRALVARDGLLVQGGRADESGTVDAGGFAGWTTTIWKRAGGGGGTVQMMEERLSMAHRVERTDTAIDIAGFAPAPALPVEPEESTPEAAELPPP